MAEELEAAKTFSELQLGVRELFRILVPGAFALALVYVLAPTNTLFAPFLSNTVAQVVFVLFTGLIAYALQAHELWWPYNRSFERWRSELNRAIVDAVGGPATTDYVNAYKFFLETKALDMRSRVHYFSSFYYMLTELSLISAMAAVSVVLATLTEGFLFRFVSLGLAPIGTASASGIVVGALVLQIVLMALGSRSKGQRADVARRGRPEETTPRRVDPGRILQWATVLPWILIAAAIALLIYQHLRWKRSDLVIAAVADYRGWAFTALAVTFGLLAQKNWRSIISEQVFLVRNRRPEIVAIVEAFKS
jgi:hypothetical protein